MSNIQMSDVISPRFVEWMEGLRQQLYDDAQRKILRKRSFFRRHLWIAEIKPAHREHSCLARLLTADHSYLAFAVEARPQSSYGSPNPIFTVSPTIISVGPTRMNKDWDDPFAKALTHISAWEVEGFGGLDGVEYHIFVSTFASRVAIEFGNPQEAHFVELQRGLVEVAELLIPHDSTNFLREYLEHWKRYVHVG